MACIVYHLIDSYPFLLLYMYLDKICFKHFILKYHKINIYISSDSNA